MKKWLKLARLVTEFTLPSAQPLAVPANTCSIKECVIFFFLRDRYILCYKRFELGLICGSSREADFN